MSTNCDFIVIFPIYGQFVAIRKADSGRIVCKAYIFITSNLLFTKTENRTKESLTQLSLLWVKVVFLPKTQKNADISKIKRASVLLGYIF